MGVCQLTFGWLNVGKRIEIRMSVWASGRAGEKLFELKPVDQVLVFALLFSFEVLEFAFLLTLVLSDSELCF